MPLADIERRRAYQAEYDAAHVETKRAYDQQRLLREKLEVARHRYKHHPCPKFQEAVDTLHDQLDELIAGGRIETVRAARRGEGAYQTPEQLRESVRRHVAWLIEDGIPVSVNALRRAGVAGKNARISAIVAELAASGEIPAERLDAKRDRRLKTPRGLGKSRERIPATVAPPMSSHAPEVQDDETDDMDTNLRLYWTPARRAWYRRQA